MNVYPLPSVQRVNPYHLDPVSPSGVPAHNFGEVSAPVRSRFRAITCRTEQLEYLPGHLSECNTSVMKSNGCWEPKPGPQLL